MSVEENDGRASPLRSVLARIQLAASFLTILPILGPEPESAAEVAESFGWFPLIGFLLGVALCIEDQVLSAFTGGFVRAAVEVATLTLLTGAIHLDGLADAADAIGARGDRDRALAIMRDSRIGTYGTLAIVLSLMLKIGALAQASEGHRAAMLFLAPGLGRWAMVATAYRMRYLRASGAGSDLLSGDADGSLRTASIIALIGLAVPGGWVGLGAGLCAALLVLLIRWFYRRWLGGITGDLIGAAGDVVETALFVILAC
jgi:adenosylcobinamide-GDP ribazoletransferase